MVVTGRSHSLAASVFALLDQEHAQRAIQLLAGVFTDALDVEDDGIRLRVRGHHRA